MSGFLLFVFLALSRLPLLPADDYGGRNQGSPPPRHPFNCGNLGEMKSPFITPDQRECGSHLVLDCDTNSTKIQLQRNGTFYQLQNLSGHKITVRDEGIEEFLNSNGQRCSSLTSVVSDDSPPPCFSLGPMIKLLKCHSSVRNLPPHTNFHYTGCRDDYIIYYNDDNHCGWPDPPPPPPPCSLIQLPAKPSQNFSDIFSVITATFHLELQEPPHDHRRGGERWANSTGEFGEFPNGRCNGSRKFVHSDGNGNGSKEHEHVSGRGNGSKEYQWKRHF